MQHVSYRFALDVISFWQTYSAICHINTQD